MFVDIQESSANMLALRRALSTGGAASASTPVTLTLEDGSRYAQTGRIEFAEAIVDPDTGSVTLRARFPNPDSVLLPGSNHVDPQAWDPLIMKFCDFFGDSRPLAPSRLASGWRMPGRLEERASA
jgi:hypothetical protein